MQHHLNQCSNRRRNAKRRKTDADALHQATVDFGTGQDNSADCGDEGSDTAPTVDEQSFSDSSDSGDSFESMDDYFLDHECANAALHAEATKQEEEGQRESEALEDLPELDLDPDSVSDNEEDEMDETHPPIARGMHAERAKYSYEDFSFFDWRDDKAKSRNRCCQTQIYFYQRYVCRLQDPADDTGGFRGLVHRASTGNREDASTVAPREEAHLFFLLFNLHHRAPGCLKNQVIGLHHGAEKLWKTGEGPRRSVKTRFPSNGVDARRMLTDGRHAIFKNFPVPKVTEIGNHACVSIKHVILLSAAHGAVFNFGFDAAKKPEDQNMQGLNGTRAFKALVVDVIDHQRSKTTVGGMAQKGIKIGYIYLWSDGFLNCFIKQKENNVWIITVTICPPENKKSSGKYTHVLAMGRSCENHTKVFEHYLEECKELMDGFNCYFGNTNEICRVAFGLLTLHGDRPVRQAIAHNRKEGHYGKVTGMAAPVDEKKLPSCHECLKRRVGAMLGETMPQKIKCRHCFDWSLEDTEAQRTVPVEKGHPCRMKKPLVGPLSEMTLKGRELGNPKIGPVKLTGKWLEEALEITYKAVQSGAWSSPVAHRFLMTCNVITSLVDSVVKLALEDKIHGRMSVKDKYVPKIWSHPGLYDKFKLPDLPMHALAHGMITDTMNIFHQILSRHNKFQAFLRFANPVLNTVASMRLDYCKVKILPKAAWVGENVMGYTRLLSYLYGMFLSSTPLKAKEDNTTPKIIANMRFMLNFLQSLMSVLMTSHQTNDESRDMITKNSVDNHMKLLMSTADLLHRSVGIMPSKTQSSKTSRVALLKGLKKRELVQMLDFFRPEAENGSKSKGELTKVIMKIKKSELIRKSKTAWELDIPDKTLVGDVQTKVFGAFLEQERDVSLQHAEGEVPQERDVSLQHAEGEVPQRGTQSSLQENEPCSGNAKVDGEDPLKEQTRCWNKGNWLSFTANIANQTYYLGCLLLLW